MARAIPDQPSRTATSISIVHRVHRRPARANCVAVAASSVTYSTGKVAYGEDHSRPDGAHSRFLKTAGADLLQP
jgi:hypothetical protein